MVYAVPGVTISVIFWLLPNFFAGSGLAAFSFMIFNLLCAPCFAAMGAIKREMNNAKWTWGAIGYMCVFAYTISLIVYQLGMLVCGGGFGIWTAVAIALLAVLVYLIFRKNKYNIVAGKTTAV